MPRLRHHVFYISTFILLAASNSSSQSSSLAVGGSCNGDDDCAGYPGKMACLSNKCHNVSLEHCLNDGGQNGNASQMEICKSVECTKNEDQKRKCYWKDVSVGEPCIDNDQCTESLGPLSECVLIIGDMTRKCHCKENEAVSSQAKTKCLALAKNVGDACEENQQCDLGVPGFFSECAGSGQDKYCRCKTDAVSDASVNETCYLTKNHLGEECSIQEQCKKKMGDLAECSQENKCTCSKDGVANMVWNRCLPANILIGKECQEYMQCVGEPQTSSTCSVIGQCICLAGYITSQRLDNCLKIQNDNGAFCEEDIQCTLGKLGDLSGCQGSKCLCHSYAINDNGVGPCQVKANHTEEPCEIHDQCRANLIHSECRNKQCICIGGTVASENKTKCLLKTILGGSCEENIQCADMDNSMCEPTTSVCQCETGYENVDARNKNSCLKLASVIGNPCDEHDGQCKTLWDGGATCDPNSKQCLCGDGEVASEDETRCLQQVPSLGLKCEVDGQCSVHNSVCHIAPNNEMQCVCNPNGYVQLNDKCVRVGSIIGDYCEDDIQCTEIGTNSTVKCVSGQCNCPPPSKFYNNDYCVAPRMLNQTCGSHEQCYVGVNMEAVCVTTSWSSQRICICNPPAVPEDNICYRKRVLGDICMKDKECSLFIPGEVMCSGGRCACSRNATGNPGEQYCDSSSPINVKINYIIILICLVITGKLVP